MIPGAFGAPPLTFCTIRPMQTFPPTLVEFDRKISTEYPWLEFVFANTHPGGMLDAPDEAVVVTVAAELEVLA